MTFRLVGTSCFGGCGLALLAVLCLGAVSVASSGQPGPGQWILVTRADGSPALAPLIERRRGEGFSVVVVTNELPKSGAASPDDAAILQGRLRNLARKYYGPTYILLAGNALTATATTNAQDLAVPALRGATGRMKGCPTDFGYALPDPDGVPAVRVGRFPARTVDELRGLVQKTLRFEQDAPAPGAWQDRLLLMVGNPGGGPLSEMFLKQNFNSHVAALHPSWQVRTIMNIDSSPYYLPRPQDRKAALDYLRGGNLFSVYLGHSGAEGMGLDGRFFLRKDWSEVRIPSGAGPFFTVGCWACQSDGKGDGYGLAAMRNRDGPVAVIGASGESYSAPGQLAVEGLLSQLVQPPFSGRLGEYWLAAQTGLARGHMDPTTFALLDAADGTGGKVPLATQRLEHLEMWMLLGDPALRMPVVPMDVSLQPLQPIAAGQLLQIRGTLPARLSGAAVRVALERPLNSAPAGLEKVPPSSPDIAAALERVIAANHRRANSFEIAGVEVAGSGTEFAASLAVPADLAWKKLVVRAAARAGNQCGLAAISVPVKADNDAPAAQGGNH